MTTISTTKTTQNNRPQPESTEPPPGTSGSSPAPASPPAAAPTPAAASTPATTPTPETARVAQARLNGDTFVSYRVQQLLAQVPPEHFPGPAGWGDPTFPNQETVRQAVARANAGDLSAVDEIDVFRSTLSPDEQKEYDRRLAALRNEVRGPDTPNGRIDFTGLEQRTDNTIGKELYVRNPAAEDLVLRGMLAATWGRPDLLEQILQHGAQSADGAVTVEMTERDELPSGFPAQADPSGDMKFSIPSLFGKLNWLGHDNLHEATHLMQLGAPPSGFHTLPPGSTPEDVARFEHLYRGAYGPNDSRGWDDKAHYFTTVMTDFRLRPAWLRQQSPELYEFMVSLMNHRPLYERDDSPLVQ